MLINRIIKYILIGIITILAVVNIIDFTVSNEELAMIGFVVAIAYAILDKLLPSIHLSK
jgi:hypothetical protein